ncbi:MAG: hypothetical protein WD079_04400 [Phycisphaeraceae bacterium]
MSKPRHNLIACVAVVTLILQSPMMAAEEEALALLKRTQVDGAVEHAIAYIITQQREDGWISDRGDSNRVATTSLAIMAMAAVGHQPADPTPEGRAMAEALAFVLHEDRQDERGYFGQSDGSRMYGHGITTLMLGEMIGHGVSDEQDARIRERCQHAIDLILSAQKVPKHQAPHQGGWRYTPDSNDADLSVTVWQLMALRSAYNAGLDVPASAIEEAVEYLRASYRSNERDDQGRPLNMNSGFGYQPGGGPGFSTTAMGMLAMIVCGEYEAPEVVGASNYLMDNPPTFGDRWFFYGAYYYAQGMYQRGGEIAQSARDHIEPLLLEHQREDGSWEASGGTEHNAGKVYATAMGVLSLSVKYHYLPIYQR